MGHDHLPPEIDLAVRSFIRRHKRALRLVFFAAIGLTLVLAVGAVWAVVWGAVDVKDYVAQKGLPGIPTQLDQRLGEIAFAQLKAQTRFIADPRVTDPLNRLAEPLLRGTDGKSYRFTLSVVDSAEVNAFALPGGYIAVNRGLLQRAATAEEIQGVLAHEMAHVLKRHGLLQLARDAGLGLALDYVSGGENQNWDALLKDGAKLLSLKFSRNDERAADDLAWELLQNAQINPQGMVDFFVGLAKEIQTQPGGSASIGAALLSTHPTPQERIDRLEQKKAAIVDGAFLSFAPEFQTLRSALRSTGP